MSQYNKHYVIEYGQTSDELANTVNEQMKYDYIPIGGIAYKEPNFYQAMIQVTRKEVNLEVTDDPFVEK